MHLLITGFEPFGGEELNPSTLAAARVKVDGVKIDTLVMPTEFGVSSQILLAAIEKMMPDWVIMLGQAAGRCHITPERVAINIDDASIPDNAGNTPRDRTIKPGGPAAYFSTLPIKEMVAAMHNVGVPASVSNTAGTYVCNHVFYRVMDHIANKGLITRAGFIHIPLLPGQALTKAQPSMDLEQCCRGLEAGIALLKSY